MLEPYEALCSRYPNRMFLIDDNGLKAVLLCTEPVNKIKRMIVKFKYSKFGFVSEKEVEHYNLLTKNKIVSKIKEYKFDLVEFVTYALSRGYDFKLYGEVEWKEIAPEKKKKFIKPKKR